MKQWGLKKPVKLSTTVVDERLLTDFNLKKKLNRLENEQSFKILYLARLEKEKGVFEVVDSVKILIDRGLNVSLAIAGDGPFLDELELYISSLKLPQGKIQLLGYVKGKDKIKALTNCSIYCFPSYYGEGLPNSVLEAIAFASPVITTSVGGLADFFRDGEMGIFVEPKNCDQLAETMESLIKNRIKLLQMAKYNYDYAQQYLLAPKIADFLKHTYKEMIKTETC
jgi:glycosyltransferase involved in cell wall biosynthesis